MPDITQASVYLPLIGGVLIPFIVAILAKVNASILVKSALATLAAGLVAVGTYLVDVNSSHTLKGVISAFVLALVAAAASRVTVTGGFDDKVAAKTSGFGVG